MLGNGGPVDHVGEVFMLRPEVERATMAADDLAAAGEGFFRRRQALDFDSNRLMWADRAVSRITSAFAGAGLAPPVDPGLLAFMKRAGCCFSARHLEHSFFLHDFAAIHMPDGIAKAIFLHSTLGTRTNRFPMLYHHLPGLRQHLSHFEMRQVMAFQSVQRLLHGSPLMKELIAGIRHGRQLASVSFVQSPNNTREALRSDDFWAALNLQALHAMDFIPHECWSQAGTLAHTEPRTQLFLLLVDLLDAAGELLHNLSCPHRRTEAFGGCQLSSTSTVAAMDSVFDQDTVRYAQESGTSLSFQLMWQ